jgi:hypothetical protein
MADPVAHDDSPEAVMQCGMAYCSATATHRPVLMLWAAQTVKHGVMHMKKPAEAEVGIGLCAEHAKYTTAQDLITDEGWRLITEAFLAAKKMPPVRHMTKLKLIPLH